MNCGVRQPSPSDQEKGRWKNLFRFRFGHISKLASEKYNLQKHHNK